MPNLVEVVFSNYLSGNEIAMHGTFIVTCSDFSGSKTSATRLLTARRYSVVSCLQSRFSLCKWRLCPWSSERCSQAEKQACVCVSVCEWESLYRNILLELEKPFVYLVLITEQVQDLEQFWKHNCIHHLKDFLLHNCHMTGRLLVSMLSPLPDEIDQMTLIRRNLIWK
jgi:hypothetical protein